MLGIGSPTNEESPSSFGWTSGTLELVGDELAYDVDLVIKLLRIPNVAVCSMNQNLHLEKVANLQQ